MDPCQHILSGPINFEDLSKMSKSQRTNTWSPPSVYNR